MYKTCKSYADQSECVDALAVCCEQLEKKLGLSSTDARTVALRNMHDTARVGQMTLNLLDSWMKGDQTIRMVIPQLLGIQSGTPVAIQQAGKSIGKAGKLAMVLLVQFQIENLLRNISRELKVLSPSMGFYRCARDLLNLLKLPPSDLEILNVAARLRYSLHSNGIHHKISPHEQAIIVLDGVQYEFHDQQKISCASWEHIAHALECSVKILDKICSHPQVAAIQDPLFEHNAWEEETRPQP